MDIILDIIKKQKHFDHVIGWGWVVQIHCLVFRPGQLADGGANQWTYEEKQTWSSESLTYSFITHLLIVMCKALAEGLEMKW